MSNKYEPSSGFFEGKKHLLPVRVYFEDTDAGGMVYHANYIRYFERGRTDFLRATGLPHSDIMFGDDPYIWVVKDLSIDYKSSAKLDDALVVETRLIKLGGASITMAQRVLCGDVVRAQGVVRAAVVSDQGRPRRFPAVVHDKMAEYLMKEEGN